jgi:FkbM family methyltransferase
MQLEYDTPRDINTFAYVTNKNAYHIPDNGSGKIFVDIGANLGAASSLAGRCGFKIYAFEPCKRTYDHLVNNTIEFNIVCKNVGIGKTGNRWMNIYEDSGCNTLLSGLQEPQVGKERVTIISLKEAMKDIPYCDFMKIDCEGGEFEFQDELVELADRIAQVVIEIHYDLGNMPGFITNLMQVYKRKENYDQDVYSFTHG